MGCTFQGSNLKPILLPRLLYDFLSLQCGLESNKKRFLCLNVECSLQSSFTISGCSSFLLFNDKRTESESENMMNFVFFFRDNVESQVYCTGLSCENRIIYWQSFVFIILFKTAAHAVLL